MKDKSASSYLERRNSSSTSYISHQENNSYKNGKESNEESDINDTDNVYDENEDNNRKESIDSYIIDNFSEKSEQKDEISRSDEQPDLDKMNSIKPQIEENGPEMKNKCESVDTASPIICEIIENKQQTPNFHYHLNQNCRPQIKSKMSSNNFICHGQSNFDFDKSTRNWINQ